MVRRGMVVLLSLLFWFWFLFLEERFVMIETMRRKKMRCGVRVFWLLFYRSLSSRNNGRFQRESRGRSVRVVG